MKNLIPLLKLSYSNLKNFSSIFIYRSFGKDFSSPIVINAKVTNSCNSRCNMCDVWRYSMNEIPSSVWIRALNQLRSSYNNFKIGFIGGEVLLKNDIFEIFDYCFKNDLPFGITTNGKLLTPNNIHKLLELNPMNINISIDSLNEEVYKAIRGVPFLETVKSNIEYLTNYIKKNSSNTKVFFKTVINAYNLKELHSIANYASEMNVSGITFDPIRRRKKIFLGKKIDEFEKMANIDMNLLSETISKLIQMKERGIRILNSKENMYKWFKETDNNDNYFCSVPLRSIYINSEGFVRLCDFSDIYIGNILDSDIRLILKSLDARREKQRLTNCKNPCVYCIHRNLNDYVKLFFSYLKN